MIHTDGRPTIANHGSERLLARPKVQVDPATTADCDGYPSLADPHGFPLPDAPVPCCGDPGDCGTCGK